MDSPTEQREQLQREIAETLPRMDLPELRTTRRACETWAERAEERRRELPDLRYVPADDAA